MSRAVLNAILTEMHVPPRRIRPKPTGSPKNPKGKRLGDTQKIQGNIK
jgi:hypothetical protein